MIAMLDVLHPDPPARLYRAILWHDAAERWTGDIQYMAAQMFPDLKTEATFATEHVEYTLGIPRADVTPEERSWLKALDMLEFYVWAAEEAAMGNGMAREAYVRQQRNISIELSKFPEPCREFFQEFEWRRTEDDIRGL
jgi:hypothetical protein